LRKLLTGGLAAAVTLGLAGGSVVHAQTDGVIFNANAAPSDAGTKRKPKNSSLTFDMKVDRPGTTTEFIDLALPRGLKFSGKGLGNCTVDDLAFEGPDSCADSAAGPEGSATATLGAENQLLNFNVRAFVQDANSLVFYVATEEGTGISVQSPITGEISGGGRKLRIRIPQELRQPVPGVDASLTGLNYTFKAKRGRNYLVRSTACASRKHRYSATLTFTARADGTPVPPPVTGKATSRCRK
jgi:hypothetical protein